MISKPSVTALLYAAVAVGCGIAALVLWSMEHSRLSLHDKGASVEGTITRSWVTKGGRRSTLEEHWIDYTYAVSGVTLKGEERRVSAPLGGHVRVWYDAKRPGRCVSDAELRYGPELKAVFMTGFFGLVALVGAVRELFRRRA